MRNKNTDEANRGLNLMLQELEENPYKKFKIAFALMSVIPFLVFVYILAARLFTFDIFCGDIGVLILIAMIISFVGFLAGYGILKGIMNKIMYYAARAKASDRTKSEFVASVSHELKNPLAVIKANLSNLKDGLLGDVNERQKRAVELSQNVIDRMNHLISDLLDLHRMESGFAQMHRCLCDVSRIMERQINEQQSLANRKNIKLTGDVLGSNLLVWADEDKLSRVINNLLGNAIKYTPETGFVKARTSRSDEFVRIEVEDTAPGISSDNREKIFDKFKRLEDKGDGTGLGLAIAKDIVELHKGKIWAEISGTENGNKFVVVLPSDLRGKTR